MDRIPIYARGGAVIPMWPEAPASTANYFPKVIELHLFVPTEDGTHRSLLQEDDGLTFAALTGERVRTVVEVTRSGSSVTLEADVDGDGYPDFAREEFHLVVHGAQPGVVRVDDDEVAAVDGRFAIVNAGTSFSCSLEV
jgi:alpha-glucosidase